MSLNSSQKKEIFQKTICRENQNTHFSSCNFFPENHAADEIMWKNLVEPEAATDDTNIWCTRFARWVTEASIIVNNKHCFRRATLVARTRFGITS
jgi:hypothetical protein